MLFQNNATGAVAHDAGLAAHMRLIFNYMTGGVALSGLVAWLTLKSPEALQFAMQAHLILFLVWFGSQIQGVGQWTNFSLLQKNIF